MRNSMKTAIFTALVVLVAGAGLSFAMNHGGGHGDHQTKTAAPSGHGDHQTKAAAPSAHGDGHMGMQMTEQMVMLGSATVDGVKAMAHISDIRAAMAEANMAATHHFMVAFAGEADNAAIQSGRVAVRITAPGGQTSSAIALHAMDGHFGADVELSEPGRYTFEVGSRVGDDKARQFRFDHEVK